MKKRLMTLSMSLLLMYSASAQKIEFEEYDLSNGLHIILHQDKSTPVVTTSVMYHVGSKDEDPARTGFAHFFEHLLFEGTKNIGRGEWMKIVSSNGGHNNATTNSDRTYYFETFPSNNLKLSLWMESERMLHPVINQIGVDTQREVVKEEKRLNVDSRAYGQLYQALSENLFSKHPYRWTTIGSMDHLDAATFDEFQAFFRKFYVPNNAVLVVAGDFEKDQVKQWIKEYFEEIPKGKPIVRNYSKEDPIVEQKKAIFEDANIQLPLLLNGYRTPSMKERDARVLDMISTLLSGGKSSRLYKRLVDNEKLALEIQSINDENEDYSLYVILGIPMTGKTMHDLQVVIDEEVNKIRTELISNREFEKIQNRFEQNYVNSNSTMDGIASNLASYYLLYGDTNLINSEIEIYRSITREEIQNVANKYLQSNQRVIIDYLPKK